MIDARPARRAGATDVAARAHRHRHRRRRPAARRAGRRAAAPSRCRRSATTALVEVERRRRRRSWTCSATSSPTSGCRSTACRRASRRSTRCSCDSAESAVDEHVEAERAARSTTAATGPTKVARGRRGAATFALYKASMRRALGLRRSWRQKVAPFVLLGIVTIPAIVNVGIGYVTRDRVHSTRADRDHHLPRVRRRVGRAAAVRRAGRARRHLPRPAPARAAADVRPSDDRRRLRRRQGRRDRDDPVRVLVPAPGRAVRRQHARERQRARLLHRPPRRAVEGAGRGRAARRLLRGHRRRDLVAHRPAHRRRRGGHRPVPRHVDRVGRSSSATSRRVRRRLGRPRSSTCSRCRCTCATSCSSATSTRSRRSAASTNGGLLAIVTYVAVVAGRRRRSCSAATAGWNDDGAVARRRGRADDPAFVADATVDGRRRVGVVRPEGRAVGAELLVRTRRHRPARPERRGQDHADARDHRPHRRQPGQRDASRAATRGATARCIRRLALVPEDEAVPAGLTARQFVRYVADLHGVADRDAPEDALRTVGDARRRRPPRRRRSARACASARRSRPRS